MTELIRVCNIVRQFLFVKRFYILISLLVLIQLAGNISCLLANKERSTKGLSGIIKDVTKIQQLRKYIINLSFKQELATFQSFYFYKRQDVCSTNEGMLLFDLFESVLQSNELLGNSDDKPEICENCPKCNQLRSKSIGARLASNDKVRQVTSRPRKVKSQGQKYSDDDECDSCIIPPGCPEYFRTRGKVICPKVNTCIPGCKTENYPSYFGRSSESNLTATTSTPKKQKRQTRLDSAVQKKSQSKDTDEYIVSPSEMFISLLQHTSCDSSSKLSYDSVVKNMLRREDYINGEEKFDVFVSIFTSPVTRLLWYLANRVDNSKIKDSDVVKFASMFEATSYKNYITQSKHKIKFIFGAAISKVSRYHCSCEFCENEPEDPEEPEEPVDCYKCNKNPKFCWCPIPAECKNTINTCRKKTVSKDSQVLCLRT